MKLYVILFFFLFSIPLFRKSLSSPYEIYEACSPNKFRCGSIVANIGYPFYDGYFRPEYCGYPGFQLYNCEATPLITISGLNYSVSDIHVDEHSISISRTDNWTSLCPDGLLNTTIDYSKFSFSSSIDTNITFFYDCDPSHDLWSLELTSTKCSLDGNASVSGYDLTQEMLEYHKDLFEICKSNLFLPILQSDDEGLSDLAGVMVALKAGFELAYMSENEVCAGCMESGGACGQSGNNKFTCHCADADYNFQCFKNDYDACFNSKLNCGGVGNIGYPFYDGSTRPAYCGYPGFQLDCIDGTTPRINISADQEYHVKGIYANSISVYRKDDWTESCPDSLTNTTIDFSRFRFSPSDENITFFYDCDDPIPSDVSFRTACNLGGYTAEAGYYLTQEMVDHHKDLFQICNSSLFLPILKSEVNELGSLANVISAFHSGFELGFIAENEACDRCVVSGGECGYNRGSNNFVCHCADADYDTKCGGSTKKGPIIIGVSVGAVALLSLFLGGCLVFARRRRNQLIAQQKSRGIYAAQGSSSNGGGLLIQTPGSNGLTSSQAFTSTPSTNLSQSMPSYGSSKSGIGTEKTCYFGAHVFSYAELEHATCNFHDSKELGDGGFGTVYYGVLSDGRQVAVKRLYEHSAKRVEQFMTEIRILAELHHKNLVALYGCTSKSDRVLLLVYEYVPNGTVADHIHGRLAESTFVPWLTRLSIAIQTAEALAFLHRNDVIHRDVKTANVLLDNNFHVKVADFGLSRLFPLDMTHVSTAPQGTPGYVDPEYYQCYKLTEKSDVYSFGVVLIELISSKHAVDITRHRHHVNLANMALDRIQNQELHELVDPRLGFDKDHSVQSMVKMVAELGFRCLQQDRDMRPTMDEVLTSLVAIQLEGLKARKQDVVDIHVYGDDVGLLTNPTPPLSPELPRSNDVV